MKYLLLLIVFIIIYYNLNNYEHFILDNNVIANDCYSLSNETCNNYSNCGLCIKNGKSTCVPGDVHGPSFTESCQKWKYTNYHDRHIFNESVTTITNPWNTIYPDYQIWYPSPVSWSAL